MSLEPERGRDERGDPVTHSWVKRRKLCHVTRASYRDPKLEVHRSSSDAVCFFSDAFMESDSLSRVELPYSETESSSLDVTVLVDRLGSDEDEIDEMSADEQHMVGCLGNRRLGQEKPPLLVTNEEILTYLRNRSGIGNVDAHNNFPYPPHSHGEAEEQSMSSTSDNQSDGKLPAVTTATKSRRYYSSGRDRSEIGLSPPSWCHSYNHNADEDQNSVDSSDFSLLADMVRVELDVEDKWERLVFGGRTIDDDCTSSPSPFQTFDDTGIVSFVERHCDDDDDDDGDDNRN